SEDHADAIDELLEFSMDYVQELKGRRSGQFDALWSDEFRDLWLYLNDLFKDNSWINLKLRPPMLRTRDELRIALDEFGKTLKSELTNKLTDEVSNELKETENRLSFEMGINSVRELIQQGLSLLNSNSQSASIILSSALERAEQFYTQRPRDERIALSILDASELLGSAYFELLSPRKSYDNYMRATSVISDILPESEDADRLNQRRTTLVISKCFAQFYAKIDSTSALYTIEEEIDNCIKQVEISQNSDEWRRLHADALTLEGILLRDLGNYAAAENATRSAITILSSVHNEERGWSVYSMSWKRSILASILRRNGELETACSIIMEEWDSSKSKATRQTEDSDIQQLHLFTTRLLSCIHCDQNHLNEAIELAREAVEIAERYSLINATALRRTRDLASTRLELARFIQLKRELKKASRSEMLEARELLRAALPVLERVDSLDPNGYQAALDLGTCYLELAKVQRFLGEKQNIEVNLERAQDALSRALTNEADKGPVYLKMVELFWIFYRREKRTTRKETYRIKLFDNLHDAKIQNAFLYPAIQAIEKELSDGSHSNGKSQGS
ncbi:MAG: hypothetical protein KDA74_19505, partial [Planctomycetaceae bacterium]|nr:hypothetical protein [Planctomycetaceae bacterium]